MAKTKSKLFKVREIWMLKGWTFVEAKNREEAAEKLMAGQGQFEPDEQEEYPFDTDWASLKEYKG